jgi:predicted component of type VI protein secretion system
MLKFTKALFAIGLLITVAGCSSWNPLSRSDNPVNAAKTAEPTLVPSEESVVLYGQPLVYEPPIPEPTRLP